MKTALVWDERYLAHLTGPGHPERPDRLKAIREILTPENSYNFLKPRFATQEEIGWVHSKEHIQQVLESADCASPFYFDGDTPASAKSCDAAFLGAGGVIEACKIVEEGGASNAFVFPRPPGHHAEATHAMGFCLFNNIAIAAESLVRRSGKKKIAIVDFDVHHGNGTQHFFYDRSDVFFASTHRFPFYPGTGASSERGSGLGEGFTLNVPFNARADDDDFEKAYTEVICPKLLDYKPDFILVSAGFDAHRLDPLGGLNLSKKSFSMMARNLGELARKTCGGKIVYVLEGGYDLKGLQEGVEAVLQEL